jgi:hypothetical protein
MRGTRIDKIRKGQLMDVSEPLKQFRIDHLALIGPQGNERVDWITKFVRIFHDPSVQTNRRDVKLMPYIW